MSCHFHSPKKNSKSTGFYIFKLFIILFTISFVSLFGQADNITFERLNTSHGLSNNNVQYLFQDSKGFLWIGTPDGLNRYDGYNFTTFRNDPLDSTTISNNIIFVIYEDSNNDLWIGTDGGINKFNREEETFTSYNYSTISQNNGQAVIGICEDRNRTFWLGTPVKGLTKFDRETKTFKHFLPDSNGNSNVVYQIFEDPKKENNRLWLGRWNSGFSYFDLEKETFANFEHNYKQTITPSGTQTNKIYQDSEGIIWIATTTGGLNKFDPETETLSIFKNDPLNKESLSNNNVWSIYEDQNNKNILWVGTQEGLNRFDKRNKTFTVFKSDINDHTTLSNNFIFDIYKDRSGVIWVGTAGGLDKIDPGRVPFRQYNIILGKQNWLNSNQVWSFLKSSIDPSILWIGTQTGGLNKFDTKSKTFSYFINDSTNKNSINNNWIIDLYEDPDHAGEELWIGTIGGGLNRFDSKTKKFKSYTRDFDDNNSISSNNVRNIYKTRDGMLWLATSSGLNKFDREKEKFTRYNFLDTTYVAPIQNLLEKLTKEKRPLASILKAGEEVDLSKTFTLKKKTHIMLASMGEGQNPSMFDYGWLENESGKTIWKFELNKSRHAGGGTKNRMQIWSSTLDEGKYTLYYISDAGHSYGNWNVAPPIHPNLWGIQIIEITENEYSLINKNLATFEKPNSLVNDNVYSIIEDSYGMLWIATNEGLSKFDRKTELFTNYSFNKNPASISNNSIFALHLDKNGNLWIGTAGGLNRYDSKTNSFKVYTIKDGLPNDVISNILEDNNKNLWLTTNNGISKFNPDDEATIGHLTFINYNIQDGLQYNQYYRSSMHKADDGEMFFGGANGFVSFYPGQINQRPPHTLFSNFLIFNEPVTPGESSPLQKHISETKNITLSYDQNAFSFEFVALHFSRPEKNQYLYKMEGFDKDWINGYRRFAPYTNLDPGEYTFMVKASNSDGVWDDQGASIKITILPPWWQTYWAYGGYLLFFIGIIFLVDRLQRRRMIIKSKERLKMQAAEHRAESAEFQARAVQAENQRKTKELEEARDLQLSMLPTELPQLPNLDIAVYMQTATEVGGDYYDFHVGLDGTLTVVVGDATGHGMKAGTMVTTAKSLFNSYAPNPDILFTFSEITRCIKQMNFGKLSMCLTMVKIKGNKLQISTAGMPPSFIFRRDTRVVEEHMFKAMPLGTMDKFPYELKDTTLNPGDTILLISDGLPELKNDSGEMYSYKRIRNGFEDVAEKSPEDIISYFKNEGSSWVNDEAPDDDVTFVVIKVK